MMVSCLMWSDRQAGWHQKSLLGVSGLWIKKTALCPLWHVQTWGVSHPTLKYHRDGCSVQIHVLTQLTEVSHQ